MYCMFSYSLKFHQIREADKCWKNWGYVNFVKRIWSILILWLITLRPFLKDDEYEIESDDDIGKAVLYVIARETEFWEN